MGIRFEQVHPIFVVRASGCDPNQPLRDDHVTAIREAIHTHGVSYNFV